MHNALGTRQLQTQTKQNVAATVVSVRKVVSTLCLSYYYLLRALLRNLNPRAHHHPPCQCQELRG
ncbi:hypothetical protein E2C01_045211 [Portunus trituberculatus]|uniref:Uncharacterized protein n=1 Tax=Portunus trituberculatus TaxID=210409 RepID=A0A5B7G1E2_PORTR|nr:hypothetical protein [Portunus trituberculatus]